MLIAQSIFIMIPKSFGPHTYRSPVNIIFIGQLKQRYGMFQIFPNRPEPDIHRRRFFPRTRLQTLFTKTNISIGIHHNVMMIYTKLTL